MSEYTDTLPIEDDLPELPAENEENSQLSSLSYHLYDEDVALDVLLEM